jgi:hypothetical protein
MATPTPEEEIKALKAKIELQLKSNALTAAQVANQTSAYNAITNGVGALERYRDLLKSNQLIIDDIADGLDYMTKSFLDDIVYLTKGKQLLTDQKSAMSKLANIAKETLDIRLGEQAIDEKRFKKLQDNATKQIANLKLVRDLNAQSSLPNPEISKNIQAQIDATEELKKGFSKVSEVNEALNKQLGAAPKLVAGIDKAFQKLGLPDLGFSTALDETKQLGQEAASQGDEAFKKFSPMKTLTGKIGDNFKGMFTTANLMQAGIGFLIDAFISVDSAIGDMAKGLDMSYNSAANLRMELTDIANFSGDAAVNTKGLQESLMAVSQTLGVNARLSSEDLVTFTKLREQAGYTNEELTSMQRITTITGGSLEANSKTFLGTIGKLNAQNKLAINAKQLFKDIANVSDAIKLSVGGTAEKIATAAFKAKQFGINLQQADQISQSLLDFESSISNELSAELITGKDLNLEKARLLAINGDIAGASAEILKQVGGTAEFTKMNRIQQEALAKSVGMTREDLAKSLVDREASAKLGAKEGQSAQDRYNELVKSYGVEKASAMLGDEALANQFQQQSVQERLAQSVEKLKEIFVAIAEPILAIVSPIVDTLMPVIGVIAGTLGTVIGWLGKGLKFIIDWGKYLLPIYGIYKGIQIAQKATVGWEIASNAQKQIAANRGLAQIGANRTILALEKESLAAKIAGNLQLAFMLIREQGLNGLKTYAKSLDEESLARKILMVTYTGLEFVRTKAIAVWEGIKNTYLTISNNLKLKGLALTIKDAYKSIAAAAMSAYESAAKIPGVGWILGGIAAAAVVGLGASLISKGNDVVSPGYGKRTLMSPEGAITLNDKDTVIAGTNLGGGNKGKSPQPQQSAYADPALLNEMRAMRQEQSRSNSKPTVVENSMNGTKFGTALHMNTYKVQ